MRRRRDRPRTAAALAATALVLTGCTSGGATSATSTSQARAIDVFASAPDSVLMDAAAIDIPAGLSSTRRAALPAMLAPYIGQVTASDPGLAAADASLAAGEKVALTRLGADYDALLKEKGTPPATTAPAGNASMLPDFAQGASGAGRGTSVNATTARTATATAGTFATLGAVNGGLSGLFSSWAPAGVEGGGKSPKWTETKDGATSSGDIEIGIKANGDSTFGLGFDVKVATPAAGEAPAAKASGSLGFKATANPCPAADGTVKVTFQAKIGADITAGAKSAVGSTEVSGTAVGHVDDSATVTGFDIDGRQQSNGTNAAGKGTFVDTSFSYGLGNLGGGTVTAVERSAPQLNRESQGVDFAERNRLHEDGAAKAVGFVAGYLAAMEYFWQNGNCVSVIAASPGKVDPGTVSPIQVSVKHKYEAGELGLPVDAKLSGPQSIDKQRIEKAPGTITHTASSDPASRATIELVSTSRRGIGRATVSISVGGQAYRIEGGAGQFHGTGTICDIEKPWSVSGRGTMKFEPSSATGGKFSWQLDMGLVLLVRSGTYTVKADDKGGTIVGQGVSKTIATTPFGKKTFIAPKVTDHFTLTPIDPC